MKRTNELFIYTECRAVFLTSTKIPQHIDFMSKQKIQKNPVEKMKNPLKKLNQLTFSLAQPSSAAASGLVQIA
jgi:hypothetical protein